MQRRHTTPRASRGFTLIELMIVVAVIAILGAIAYPSYQESVRKGRRAEGRAALQEVMQQQERYMTQFNTYKDFAKGATGVPFKTKSEGDKYELEAVVGSCGNLQSCVKLKAYPVIADPKVGWISLDSQGKKACEHTTDMKVCWP